MMPEVKWGDADDEPDRPQLVSNSWETDQSGQAEGEYQTALHEAKRLMTALPECAQVHATLAVAAALRGIEAQISMLRES